MKRPKNDMDILAIIIKRYDMDVSQDTMNTLLANIGLVSRDKYLSNRVRKPRNKTLATPRKVTVKRGKTP